MPRSLDVPILTLLLDVNQQAGLGHYAADANIYNTVFDGINSKGDISELNV